MVERTAQIASCESEKWLVTMSYVETLEYENNVVESYRVEVTSLVDGIVRDSYDFTSATEANAKLNEMERIWILEPGEEQTRDRPMGAQEFSPWREPKFKRPMSLVTPVDPYAENPDFGLF